MYKFFQDMLKSIITFGVAILFSVPIGLGQDRANCFSPDDLIGHAMAIHPSGQSIDVAEREAELQKKWIHKNRLPQLDWNARGTLQSESLSLDLPFPNAPKIELPLYAFQTTLDGKYVLYDGGISAAMEQLTERGNAFKADQARVQMNAVKSKVGTLFFGIVLLNNQIELLDSTVIFLSTKKRRLDVAIQNGTALQSDLSRLEAQMLDVRREKTELNAKRMSLISGLRVLTGVEVKPDQLCFTTFDIPPSLDFSSRPEFSMFKEGGALVDAQLSLQEAKQRPKVSAFVKAGIGYPNPINFFDDHLSPFAIGGIQFAWPLGLWGKNKVERQKISLAKRETEIQQALFEWGIQAEGESLTSQIESLRDVMSLDDQIIRKYEQMLRVSEKQYSHGVITLQDLLDVENKMRMAKLKKAIHQNYLEQQKYSLKILLNQ